MSSTEEVSKMLQHIKDLFPDLHVTPSNIIHPNKEFVMNFYQQVLMMHEVILIKVSQHVEQISNDARGMSQFLPEINLFRQVKDIFRHIGVDTFYITDILNPEPKRTKHLMKIMVNYSLFVKNKKQDIEDVIDECLALCRQASEANEIVNNKKRLLAEVVESVALGQYKIEALQKKISDHESIRTRKLEQKNEQKELQEKNFLELQKHEEIYNNKQKYLDCRKVLLKDLQSKIVTQNMYETAKRTKEELGAALSKHEEDDTDYERALQDKKQECERYTNFCSIIDDINLELLFSTIQECEETDLKCSASQSKCDKLKKILEERTEEVLKTDNSLKMLEEKELSSKVQYKNSVKGMSSQIMEYDESRKATEAKVLLIETEIKKSQNKLVELDAYYEEMQAEQSSLEQVFNEEYRETLATESEVITEFNQCLRSMTENYKLCKEQ